MLVGKAYLVNSLAAAEAVGVRLGFGVIEDEIVGVVGVLAAGKTVAGWMVGGGVGLPQLTRSAARRRKITMRCFMAEKFELLS
jgi:hypothetical protein